MNFRYSNSGTSVNDLGVGNCSRTDVSAGIISLENNTGGSCLARSYISSDRPIVEAFEFYNSDFRFDNLVSAFKDAHVSKGKYIALYRYTLGYASILDNGVYTYNYYEADPVSFIVDYQPAYIDSIVVEGDGVFDLDYDKNSHTVKGRTKYSVFVDGYLDPGVLLTLRSSGLDTKNFYLKNGDGTHQIPYSVYCTLCEERVVVQNGLLLKEDKSRIEYTGSNLNFNLNFKFDEQKIIEPGITESGTIVEGDYSDTVALLLELDL
ncbi:hypothetical protein JCM19236_5856 [Vibrio sp. JCM 19236]|nr:hypothetical protein JCM19236_5856 [Vibrio sp. JCM 19236]